ncbi:MAG: alpha/beta fold hydrolase [Deltaproteobacteria bacterium]|nr:alpha/beta fold hydrolase [Deltaproteobacteria bacterium]
MAHAFHVPRWLRNPHLQTLGAAARLFSPPPSYATLEHEALRIPLPGPGDFRLHARAWWIHDERGEKAKRPVVVLVHGIGGSTESAYVVRAAVALHRRRYHVVRLDLRGAGQSIPDVPTLYHAGLSSDLDVVVRWLATDPCTSGVVILGFSGGGSMALKLAGELGENAPSALRAVVTVSAPLDYTKVSRWMDSVARLPYRFHVLRGLSNGARAFARTHPDRAHYRAEDVKRLSSFRYYDSTVICPMHGFRHVEEYYASASPGPWLEKILLPALIVHAEDDPMVPGKTVLPWLERATSSVEAAIAPHGGHIGFVAGLDEESWVEGWAMKRVLAFLERALEGAPPGP